MKTQANAHKTYFLDGTLLEACSCAGTYPCSLGDDPDGGHCDICTGYLGYPFKTNTFLIAQC